MRFVPQSKILLTALFIVCSSVQTGSLFLTCSAQTPATQSLQTPVKAALRSANKEISRGKPFNLFVDFEMEPGWHIYHKNPGESGMPTKVQWTLPAGFKIEEQSWPQPETFKDSGIVTYGHSKKTTTGSNHYSSEFT